ncbi:MAG: hypothetical protein K9K65_14990 [Desulfarculaceae bacterium]|nr:hypothetical protein [Desulfarculaceae bacterium]MCF8046566.1 hypothetical protein [Desulfarculaceae bacterium]MCF8099143.1 hypothetical protein [Desulfarculaceae bacterium]MCF8120921.1 hypothetical protein [Desulfarculaceae bacterium]
MALIKRLLGGLALATLALALLAGPPAHAAEAKKVLIKSVKEVGTKVVLMDGSEWSIPNPDDQELVYDWLPFQTVVVKNGKVLVNLYRGDIVDASMTKPPIKKAKAAPSTPMYSSSAVQQVGTGPAGSNAGTQVVVPEDLVNRMDKILNRMEDLEFSLKSIEMRLLRLERMAGVGP